MAGRGTMREKKPGVWELRVNTGKDPVTGAYRQLSQTVHGGKREAEAALNVLAAKFQPRRGVAVSFRGHTEEWFAQAVLSPTTRDRYEGLLRIWIYPLLGDVKLSKLDTHRIDQLYGHMASKGLAASSIRQAHSIVRKSLDQALRWDRLAGNPALLARPPRRHQNMRAMPQAVESIQKFFRSVSEQDEGMAALIWLAAATGVRRGEMCALQWRQVDLDAGELLIDQAAISVRKGSPTPILVDVRGRPAPGVLVKDTKAHAERGLSLDPIAVEVMRYHRGRCVELARRFQAELRPEAYVFSPAVDGRRPWHPDTITHAFSRARVAAGLEYFTMQGLRHWMVTTLLAHNVGVRTAGGRAGHEDTSMTLRQYGRFVKRADQEAAALLGQLLGPLPALDAKKHAVPAGEPTGTAGELTA
jgi:integrase